MKRVGKIYINTAIILDSYLVERPHGGRCGREGVIDEEEERVLRP